MGATRIAVGWIHPGDVTGCFTESLAHMLLQDRRMARIQTIIGLQTSPRIAEARCRMVEGFLNQTRDDWLLMIDADMAWDFDAFEKLVKHADPDTVPIIGGLCFAGGRSWHDRKPSIRPTLYSIGDDGMPAPVDNYERDALVQVGATGAAFLMVHRRVFREMLKRQPNDPHPWFAERYINGHSVGEDITFCLRAQACGFPVHVHTGVRISHRKNFYLDEALFDEVNS